MSWTDKFLLQADQKQQKQHKNLKVSNKTSSVTNEIHKVTNKKTRQKSSIKDDKIQVLIDKIDKLEKIINLSQRSAIIEPIFEDIIREIKREKLKGFNLTGKKVNTKPYRIIFDKTMKQLRKLNKRGD